MQTEQSNTESLDAISKKGLCWLELKRSGMVQWGSGQQVPCGGERGDSTAQNSSSINKEEDEQNLTITEPPLATYLDKNEKHITQGQLRDGKPGRLSGSHRGANAAHLLSTVTEKEVERKVITEAPVVTFMNKKRKRIIRSSVKDGKARKDAEPEENRQKHKQINRWSAERYKSAELNMLEIMKAEGAVFEKPISRHVLRTAARKRIGDTGLLDHLLKYIDNKLAPGGIERFRRCYNREGVMVYWLESADMVEIKREAGVHDPDWVPPAWWKSGTVTQDPDELNLLKQEMAKMRSHMQELVSKQTVRDQSDVIEKMHKEFVGWRAKTDQQLTEIANRLTSTQDMYKELISWKDKTEQQLLGISNSLNCVPTLKACTSFSTIPEKWEEWLDSTKFDNIQGEDLEPWFENTNFIDVVPDAVVVQDPCSALLSLPKPIINRPSQDPVPVGELQLVKDEMASTERDVQELLLPRRLDEDQINMTPDSSLTANLKSDMDNSAIHTQEMVKEMMNWKAKVEQQLMEISSAVMALQTTK